MTGVAVRADVFLSLVKSDGLLSVIGPNISIRSSLGFEPPPPTLLPLYTKP